MVCHNGICIGLLPSSCTHSVYDFVPASVCPTVWSETRLFIGTVLLGQPNVLQIRSFLWIPATQKRESYQSRIQRQLFPLKDNLPDQCGDVASCTSGDGSFCGKRNMLRNGIKQICRFARRQHKYPFNPAGKRINVVWHEHARS